MNYSHNIEKASELATEALERIHKEGLVPTPENYELWYVYYAEMNTDVTRAIDILVANGQGITNERCLELHQRFLSQSTENERVKQAGDRIQETIKSVGGAVTSVRAATNKFNSRLQEATQKLAGDDTVDPDAVKAVLDDMVNNTKNMMQHNAKLEEELTKSTSIMQELKRDLEMVRKEALTDSLTNLSNRKAFDSELARITQEAKETGLTFCLIMMDIDYFKSFNDTYGHQVGDQVLRLVAATLFDGVKGRDVVARYGGEEFAIILPETNVQGGMKVGDALRRAVAGKEVVNRNSGEKLGRITMSGGIAEFVQGESSEDLIGRADAALYTAKHNGRNQISAAAAPGQKKAAS